MRIRTLLVGALLAFGASAGAGDRLGLNVSPAMSYGPVTLTIRLSVEPDAENRVLLVAVDSGDYYRSSELHLDGENAPKTNVLWYRGVPAGNYEVQGVLVGADGRTRAVAKRSVTVVGSGVGE